MINRKQPKGYHFFQYMIPWVFVILILGGVFYFEFKKNDTSLLSDSSKSRCELFSQKAFTNWSEKLSKQFSDLIFAESKPGEFTVTNSTKNYKYNFDNNLNLCFIEYLYSWNVKNSETGNDGVINIKMIKTLFSDTQDPTSSTEDPLGFLAIGISPSGSQFVQTCYTTTPGSYEAAKCTSESEFDSLVKEKFGIK